MAWCPVCKCEYKDGITKCAECKVELVDALDAKNDEPMISQEEVEEAVQEIQEVQETVTKMAPKQNGIYRGSKEMAGENKSSAYILLPVGILGIIALVLIWFDVIPLYTGTTSKIITSIVMGSLFVVFIVMGILSLKNAKKLDIEAAKEGDLSKEIMHYFSENFSAKLVDERIKDDQWDELPEEERYFKRIECIKECIINQFMNLDENYIDYMCDEIYTKFYEE